MIFELIDLYQVAPSIDITILLVISIFTQNNLVFCCQLSFLWQKSMNMINRELMRFMFHASSMDGHKRYIYINIP
ncbi:hypothetical protein ACH48_15825 [Aeromonas caviae]|nr:hypothetical protein ACH48_15825 [Aeromonas caviae]